MPHSIRALLEMFCLVFIMLLSGFSLAENAVATSSAETLQPHAIVPHVPIAQLEKDVKEAKSAVSDTASALKKAGRRLTTAQNAIDELDRELLKLNADISANADPAKKAKLEAKIAEQSARREKIVQNRDYARKLVDDAQQANQAANEQLSTSKQLLEKAYAERAAANAAQSSQKRSGGLFGFFSRTPEEKAAAEKAAAEKKAEQMRMAAEKKAAQEKAAAEKAMREEAKRQEAERIAAEKKAAAEKTAEKLVAQQAVASQAGITQVSPETVAPRRRGFFGWFSGSSARSKQAVENSTSWKPVSAESSAAPVAQAGSEKTLDWAPKAEYQKPLLAGGQTISVPEPAKREFGTPGRKYQFDLPMAVGDKQAIEKLPVWRDWSEFIIFNPVTSEDIQEFYVKLVKALQEEGYVFAKVEFPTRVWEFGIFLVKVDCGPLGKITVRNARHFSEEQIARKLSGGNTNFNYAKVYGGLFDLNANPDLKLTTTLKPEIQGGRRVINADITVDDKVPVHGAMELSNSGSKSSSNDWRLRTTLQHLNITDRFDTFTLDWMTGAFDGIADDLNAITGSYYLPLDERLAFNMYGGWNESETDAVLAEIDARGRGWFLGAQATYTLRETPKYRDQLTFSWFYQNWRNRSAINGVVYDNRDLNISMPGITYGYVEKAFDQYGGRNFASLSIQVSKAGHWGADDSKDFNEQGRAYADGDFVLARAQLARFQHLFTDKETPGKWTLFLKSDIQAASDTLPPSLRGYLGGRSTVRGYDESELGGDNVISGTIELRTPLLENFLPGLARSQEYLEQHPDNWSSHRLQFLAFTDFGYLENKTPLPGEDKDQGFASLGLGLRLGLTKYTQMAVDYGYPLIKASDDTPRNGGRFHLSIQAQF